MRRVVVSTNAALEGVMDEPEEWFLQFANDEHNSFYRLSEKEVEG
jgi:hypothetical protein